MVTTEPSAVAPVPSTAIPSSLNVITAPYVVGLSVVGVSVVVGSSVTAGVFVVVGSSVTAGILLHLVPLSHLVSLSCSDFLSVLKRRLYISHLQVSYFRPI